jgi:hypothetical protein
LDSCGLTSVLAGCALGILLAVGLDYPKHKLDGLLLIEADDDQTRDAIEKVGGPAWIQVLPRAPGTPRTKPRAIEACPLAPYLVPQSIAATPRPLVGRPRGWTDHI